MTIASDVHDSTGACPFGHSASVPRTGTPFAPAPEFAEWRAEAPATRLRAENGTVGWFVTGYELARKVLEDPRFSMKDRRTPLGPSPIDYEIDPEMGYALMTGNVLGIDPPQHTKVRRTIVGRFSVRAVRGRRGEFGEFIAQQLHRMLEQGATGDLFRDYALPISVFAHCRVLGIPDELSEDFADVFAIEELRFDHMVGFAKRILALKREHPGEDTATDIVQSELTDHEQLGILTVLMGSGRDAVAYMIGTVMVSLLRDPGQLEALREDPSLIHTAIEEFIRFHAMFISTHPRTAAEDVTIDGIDFAEGDAVWVSTVAANRDGNRFDAPDTFDVTRDAFGHVGFGHGIHMCIGQQLARVVIGEAISQLIAAAPSMRLIEAEQLQPMKFAGDLPTYAPGAVRVAWS